MRLDRFLVARGYFSTREKAKLAIKLGKVRVDGRVVTKPSARVRAGAEVEVLSPEVPKGYWKLAELDGEWGIFKGGERVLDLGSSAGGFLLYASERAALVVGIEFSAEFEDVLREIEAERENVRVYIADAFTFEVERLPELDVILADLTLPPGDALLALKRFLPRLRRGGRVLFVAKGGAAQGFEGLALRLLRAKEAEGKRERYYLLEKV
ncbi:MAG: TlyA family rRNA (cytidine-2'-O)-methyltransferase [Euryarchaeota archaeon]|nr:TlyA family rRNA (cytidine-2'-O)-methyltransferase [Euryarchaeota archaeon]